MIIYALSALKDQIRLFLCDILPECIVPEAKIRG